MVGAEEHLDTLDSQAGVFFESTKRNFIRKLGDTPHLVKNGSRRIRWHTARIPNLDSSSSPCAVCSL
jgi:hypothetical protein